MVSLRVLLLRTHINDDKEREAIASLVKLGVVRQDWRSLEFCVDDERAVFYTVKAERAG